MSSRVLGNFGKTSIMTPEKSSQSIDSNENTQACTFSSDNNGEKTVLDNLETGSSLNAGKNSDKVAAKAELTAAEKARCERNRQKALLLRQSRLSDQQLSNSTARCNRYAFICM